MSNAGTFNAHGRNGSNPLPSIGRFASRSLKMHRSLIAGVVACVVGATAVYLLLLRPHSYTASSTILMEKHAAAPQSETADQHMRDQYQILRSDAVLKRVIQELDLLNDPVFAPPLAIFSKAAFTSVKAQDDSHALGAVLDAVRKRVTVVRINNSSAFEIHVTTGNPQLAANIANGIVSAYVATPMNAAGVPHEQGAASESGAQNALSRGAVRVLSAASEPLVPDGPNVLVFLGLAGLGGLAAGTALAMTQEAFRRKIASPEILRTACGLECFGVLPMIETRPRGVWRFGWKEPPEIITGFVDRVPMLEWAVERPCSLFAHTLRRVRAATFRASDTAPTTVVLGVTSAMPREGKTLVAANLARIAAVSGKRVLLIDAVPYNYQLTKLLAAPAQRRFGVGRAPAEDEVVLRDQVTHMHFLPGSSSGPAGETRAISEALFAAIKVYYELIVIDLPPLLPVSDVHELTPLLDKVVLVTEWGRWATDDLTSALNASPLVREKVIGAVLNKAAPWVLRRFAEDVELAAGGAYADYVNDQRAFPRRLCELRMLRETQSGPLVHRETAALHLWRDKKANGRTEGSQEGSNDNA